MNSFDIKAQTMQLFVSMIKAYITMLQNAGWSNPGIADELEALSSDLRK